MEIIKAKYNSDQIGRYIEKKRKLFKPVTKGYMWVRINRLMEIAAFIFIIISEHCISALLTEYPWRGEVYGLYMTCAMFGTTFLLLNAMKDHIEQKNNAYIKCGKAFKMTIKGLEVQRSLYKYLEEIQGEISDAAAKDPVNALTLIGIEDENAIEELKDGVIDFTANDEELKEFVKLMKELERKCRRNGML